MPATTPRRRGGVHRKRRRIVRRWFLRGRCVGRCDDAGRRCRFAARRGSHEGRVDAGRRPARRGHVGLSSTLHLTRPESGARFLIWGGLRDSETACGAGVWNADLPGWSARGRLLGHRPPQIKKRTPDSGRSADSLVSRRWACHPRTGSPFAGWTSAMSPQTRTADATGTSVALTAHASTRWARPLTRRTRPSM